MLGAGGAPDLTHVKPLGGARGGQAARPESGTGRRAGAGGGTALQALLDDAEAIGELRAYDGDLEHGGLLAGCCPSKLRPPDRRHLTRINARARAARRMDRMEEHAQLLDARRAHAIVSRTRLFAGLFAVLTVGWIALDSLAYDGRELALLAAARCLAGTAFAVLAFCCRVAAPTLRDARLRLAALLVVPCAFFLASQAILPVYDDGPWHHAMATSYGFFPVIVAAGIGAFPLAVAEIAAATIVLAGVQIAALSRPTLAAAVGGYEMAWVLLLVAAASGFGAASQLRLLAALVDTAVRDPLTDCLRRESGTEVLELQFALAHRHGAPLSVLFADIDRFKQVNDAFGHEAGDVVLAATAEALRAASRASDSVVRWGGEEFVMVLPDATLADAVRCIERLRLQGAGRLPDGREVTVSIGVAERLRDGEPDARRLVALADERMYAAKQAGRNRYVGAGGAAAAVPIMAETSAAAR